MISCWSQRNQGVLGVESGSDVLTLLLPAAVVVTAVPPLHMVTSKKVCWHVCMCVCVCVCFILFYFICILFILISFFPPRAEET